MSTPSPTRPLRVCALYPDLLNIYADRGNLLVLERRCAWRGIPYQLTPCGLGEPLHPDAHDLFYLGGGQDRDQLLCAEDLVASKRDALHTAAARGAIVLGICGGYQLLGNSYELRPGEEIAGVGLLDVHTVRGREDPPAPWRDPLAPRRDPLAPRRDPPAPRLIGNVAIEVALETGEHQVLAGFENHGGRSHLGAGQAPLGAVLKGYGNDGRSGYEGARRGNTIGTYLHGPLLPKNVWFADWLIATALGIGWHELAPLDDNLEGQAHAAARRAAGV